MYVCMYVYTVVRAKVLKTYLLGESHVGVVTTVHLVMKNKRTYLTPGKLVVAVPLDPNWECDCPGVEDFAIGHIYLITGVVQPIHYRLTSASYILKIDHNSLVMPWSETILDDMVKNKTAYPGLIFRPILDVYRIYFVDY